MKISAEDVSAIVGLPVRLYRVSGRRDCLVEAVGNEVERPVQLMTMSYHAGEGETDDSAVTERICAWIYSRKTPSTKEAHVFLGPKSGRTIRFGMALVSSTGRQAAELRPAALLDDAVLELTEA